MKARITYMSESGKSAIMEIETAFGPIVQTVSGFVRLPEGHTQQTGDVLDIPATRVRKEVREVKDTSTGVVRNFDWLIFE